jgi:hypothetical protein
MTTGVASGVLLELGYAQETAVSHKPVEKFEYILDRLAKYLIFNNKQFA